MVRVSPMGNTKARPIGRAFALTVDVLRLHHADVRGLGTLGAARDVVGHLLSLIERLEALGLDGGEVDEHLGAVLAGDEAVPLLGLEPLHGSSGHNGSLLSDGYFGRGHGREGTARADSTTAKNP